MKTAIIHDVFIEFGGAERVLIALIDLYPEADIYIPLLTRERREYLKSKTKGRVITSVFNYIPFVHTASILLKPLLYLYWENLDLKNYDLVISSSHSFSSKSVITSPHTTHISYIHTPPRYLYTEFNETRIIKNKFIKILLSPLLSWLRIKDFIGAQRPDLILANSKEVQKRIKKYYRRDSIVVYPPVNLPKKILKRQPEYYLCVSRLAKQKGIDLAVKTCTQYKLPLVVVGTGSEERYLKEIAGPTVEFKGFVPDEDMPKVYSRAIALIYPSIEEDFGIVPVEAMAHGVPVVAFYSGALPEYVVDGVTGIFFQSFTIDSLNKVLNILPDYKFRSEKIRIHVRRFSQERFIEQFKKYINV